MRKRLTIVILAFNEREAIEQVLKRVQSICSKVLYVHDLNDLNPLLIGQYPGRKFFLYQYDETKPPILRTLIPDEAVKTGG
jgi:hypothetical protein